MWFILHVLDSNFSLIFFGWVLGRLHFEKHEQKPICMKGNEINLFLFGSVSEDVTLQQMIGTKIKPQPSHSNEYIT